MTIYYQGKIITTAKDAAKEAREMLESMAKAIYQSYPERFGK